MTARPTRVCIVNPFGYELFDPAARASKIFGGAEVQLYYLARALAALDEFAVSMIVERPETGADPLREGVEMITVPREGRHFARLRDRIPVPSPAYLTAMRRADADVYLQRGGAVLTGDVALHCRLAHRRFAFMAAHDWDCDRHHQRGRQYLAGAYYFAALRRADLVYAQSDFQRSQMERYHGVSSTVQRTVYPAATGAAAGRREHVLWVGRCLDWKRPMAFLDLAEGRPDVPFVMACAVPRVRPVRRYRGPIPPRARLRELLDGGGLPEYLRPGGARRHAGPVAGGQPGQHSAVGGLRCMR
jgi:Glycosyltransferase Family 4